MADPLLSTLCSICHAEPQKYKCPGCGTRTCSVPCIRKHKARAECSGERNPRAYVPAAQIRTDAGVDHDYNFLSSIERSKLRLEKEILETRGLMSQHELRPNNEKQLYDEVWYGDELHHIRKSNGPGRGKPGLSEDRLRFGGSDKNMRRRLRLQDIDMVMMPRGLQRQRDNKTAFNRRTLTINWQVEWLVADGPAPPTRIMRKVLDELPLNEAAAEALRWDQHQGDRRKQEEEDTGAGDDAEPPKKRRKPAGKKSRGGADTQDTTQDMTTTAWPCSDYTLQNSATGVWDQVSDAASAPLSAPEQANQLARWKFFLLKAGQGVSGKALIPLSSTEPLSAALSGRTVVEFPTIYVLSPSAELPGGFVLASTERRKRKAVEMSDDEDDTGHAHKRKQRTQNDGRKQPGGREPRNGRKGPRPGLTEPSSVDNGEDGEINSEGEDVDMEDKAGVDRDDSWAHSNSATNYKGLSLEEENPYEESVPAPDANQQSQSKAQQRGGLVDYGSSDDSE